MKHAIDPKVDCVFKAILGSTEHLNLSLDFLNALLETELPSPLVELELLNPYNEKEFLSDKLSIVDVKAKDQAGCFYQIEIQLLAYPSLPARMQYAWCDLYSQQLQSGQDYQQLKPTYAIWLVDDTVFPRDDYYRRYFMFRDERQQLLLKHGGILVVELQKFQALVIASPQERWLQFFKQGEQFTDRTQLPDWMRDPSLEQAMSILEQFSEKERAYHHYQARQNYLREQTTIQHDLAQMRQAVLAAQAQAEAERGARQQAQERAETERAAKEAERAAKEAALARIRELEAQMQGNAWNSGDR